VVRDISSPFPEGLSGISGPSEQPRLRPSDRWPFWPGWIDLAWGLFSVANLIAIAVFERWETIPFHFIWISVTLLYGFRIWPARPTFWVLAVVSVGTFAAIGLDVWRNTEPADELNEVPLMAAMFWAMVWHARRSLTADTERARVAQENARLLAAQRRFLQDASHQLKTPITIALGHAELIARELAGQERRDIEVVVGELGRLRGLSRRLLLIAAAEDPDFLRPEPVVLDIFLREVFRRWQPTADRDWQLGPLCPATVDADRERLALAVDALLENAVQHTGPGEVIRLSLECDPSAPSAAIVIADGGTGIEKDGLAHIFGRFRTGSAAHDGGTGLGLALVESVARGHRGEVRVHSELGHGSRFELALPALAVPGSGAEPGSAAGPARRAVPLPSAPPASALATATAAVRQRGKPR
jgi:signal transduction histidine kinase